MPVENLNHLITKGGEFFGQVAEIHDLFVAAVNLQSVVIDDNGQIVQL